MQSSPDGSAVTYLGEDFYQPHLGSLNQYLSRLEPSGWSTTNLTPRVSGTGESAIEANLDVGFSPDLSVGVLRTEGGGLETFANLYVTRGSTLEPALINNPPNREPNVFGYANHLGQPIERALRFAGGNDGNSTMAAFSHVLFEANDKLTPNAKDGGERANNLYEIFNGGLRLVNILPGQQEGDPNASFGISNNDEYNATVLPNLNRVISSDGSKIFWTDENNGNLYMRENDTLTKQIDAAVGGGGQFQAASLDGSKAFFSKAGHLYENDTISGVTKDLTEHGGVEGILGISNDGTYVYFVSSSILAGNALAGRPNLYLSHDGLLRFIATLSPEDDEIPNFYGTIKPYGDWYRTFAGRTARVSPDGRFAAFMSLESLTGYNNTDRVSLAKDYEVYLYDASDGLLVCASCRVDGAPPTANTFLPAPVNGIYQQRYLNDNGQLFFSTVEAILPEDTNGASDVYEYSSAGIRLISPGNADDEATLADASESGNDVFFTTRQELTREDTDQIVDLYDARIGGRTEHQPSAPCSGEICRGLPAPPPSFEAPPSAVFTGSGNLVPSVATTVTVVPRKKVERHPATKKRRKASPRHKGRHGRRRLGKAGAAHRRRG